MESKRDIIYDNKYILRKKYLQKNWCKCFSIKSASTPVP